MNFKEAIDFLDNLIFLGIRPGTDRVKTALEMLGNPQNEYKTIHIAGTKGKGSVTTFISYILKEAGFKVGTYTSPFVFVPNERIQYDLEYISDEDFAKTIDKIRELNERLTLTDYGSLTEFEAKTIAAFIYFREKGADYAVIETGMGGRLDATNVIIPEISIVTNVDIDHTEFLGETIEEIAFEKAGIIKDNIPCITGAREKALDIISKVSKERKAPLFKLGEDFNFTHDIDNYFSFLSKKIHIEKLTPSLLGDFQKINATIAVEAVLHLKENIPVIAIKNGTQRAFLPGRFQIISSKPYYIIIDAAHNPFSGKILGEEIKKVKYNKIILIIGMLSNHSFTDFMNAFNIKCDFIVATKSSFHKAVDEKIIAKHAKKFSENILVSSSVSEAMEIAKNLYSKGDLILVTGSFYTIGEVKI